MTTEEIHKPPMPYEYAVSKTDIVNINQYQDYINHVNAAIQAEVNAGNYEVTCYFYGEKPEIVSWLKYYYSKIGYVVAIYGDFDLKISWR